MKLSLVTIIAACYLSGVACESSGSARIVGGQVIDIQSVPYFASTLYKKRPLCGASIISNKWVISAAHCCIDTIAENYEIRTGSSRKSRGGQVHKVSRVIPHPKFSSTTLDFDFKLIELLLPLIFNDKQQKIELAKSENAYDVGEDVLTSGFGLTQNEKESNEFLRGVIVTTRNKTTCEKAYGSMITDNMFCAGSEKGQDSCQGDSGGPLESIKHGCLIGIVSFGASCADPNFPGVYSKIKSVRPWIKLHSGV